MRGCETAKIDGGWLAGRWHSLPPARRVAAFILAGSFAVLYLALLFTVVVFGSVALIAARQAFCRHSLDDGR